MKTTIEIRDELMVRAKRHARRSRQSFRTVVEEGLRLVLNRSPLAEPYRLPISASATPGRPIRWRHCPGRTCAVTSTASRSRTRTKPIHSSTTSHASRVSEGASVVGPSASAAQVFHEELERSVVPDQHARAAPDDVEGTVVTDTRTTPAP